MYILVFPALKWDLCIVVTVLGIQKYYNVLIEELLNIVQKKNHQLVNDFFFAIN